MIDEFSIQRKARSCSTGNAIIEYILPGALVTVACVGIVTAIGTGLNTDFGLLKTNMNSKVSNAQQQNQTHSLQAAAFQAAASSVTKSGGNSGSTNSYAGGSFSTAGLSPDDIAKVIQTAGANGGTETLASALTKYIDQLKADGTLTSSQLDILTKLANAGHDMANAEKALQDAVDSGSSTVTYNGQSYSVSAFGAQFGMANGMSGVSGLDPSNANPQTSTFLSLYAEAKSSGALGNSAVNDTVTYLSQQITALSALAESNIAQGQSTTNQSYAYTTANTGGSYGMGLMPVPSGGSISGDTHAASGGICNTGTGTDSGTSCN